MPKSLVKTKKGVWNADALQKRIDAARDARNGVQSDSPGTGGYSPARSLEYPLPDVASQKYAPLPFAEGNVFYDSPELSSPVDSVVSNIINRRGESALYTPGMTDIPTAEIEVTEDIYDVAILIVQAATDIIQERRISGAKANGSYQVVDPFQEKAIAQARTIAEGAHLLGAFGSPTLNGGRKAFYGFLNDPNVPSTTSSVDIASASNADIVGLFADEFNSVSEDTNLTYFPDRIGMSTRTWNRLMRRDTADEVQLMSAIFESCAFLEFVYPTNEYRFNLLEEYGIQAGGSNLDVFVIHSMDKQQVLRVCSPLFLHENPAGNFLQQRFLYKVVSSVIHRHPLGMKKVFHPRIA